MSTIVSFDGIAGPQSPGKHPPTTGSTLTLSTLSSSLEDLDYASPSETSSVFDEETGLLLPPSQPKIHQQRSWTSFFLEPKISQGNQSIPLQSESRPWLKYLIWIPLSSFASMLFVAYFWLPILREQGIFSTAETFVSDVLLKNRLAMLIVAAPMVLGIFWDVLTELWMAFMLLRGKQRRHLPGDRERLVHAVIVCNYKEPLEVLRATVASIADAHLSENIMVILACEARDSGSEDTYQALKLEFEGRVRSFSKTSHVLAPGEVIGKSSNENFACRELWKMVQKEGLDPHSVMVTTTDADSLFDSVFFEQLEGEFCRMPDGRRFIYNSPINTYRNLAECHPLVKAFEVRRCQYDLYSGLGFRPAQSNYSLTLGFAHEINFWDPTNTSEDFHTTLKAMATTGAGTDVVVRVWSLILNDSVTGFSDRWTQAKRHMWGVEEMGFILTLFPVVRINQWLGLLTRVGAQMFGVCLPASVWFLFAPVRNVFFSLSLETRYVLVALMIGHAAYDWLKTLVREIVLYKFIIGNRKLMMKRSLGEWFQLFLVWPVLANVSCFIFATMATWRMLIHAVRHDTLVYITAPKALTVDSSSSASTNNKPNKSA